MPAHEQRADDRLHDRLHRRDRDEHDVPRKPVGDHARGERDRAAAAWRHASTTPTAVGELCEMCRTAKTSAIAATPSPIAEIVVDEKTRRKLRSASAPKPSFQSHAVRTARLVDDLREHVGVRVDLGEPRLRALRRLVREAARAVLAHLEHVAVAVEQVVDDLEQQAELAGEHAPRRVLGRSARRPPRARTSPTREKSAPVFSECSCSSCAPPSRSSCWPPIIASVASHELARDGAVGYVSARRIASTSSASPARIAERLAVLRPHRRRAAALAVVVERRQVVVHERERMHELDRGGRRQQVLDRRADRVAGREAEHRPHPLAAERMAHRRLERAEVGRQRELGEVRPRRARGAAQPAGASGLGGAAASVSAARFARCSSASTSFASSASSCRISIAWSGSSCRVEPRAGRLQPREEVLRLVQATLPRSCMPPPVGSVQECR